MKLRTLERQRFSSGPGSTSAKGTLISQKSGATIERWKMICDERRWSVELYIGDYYVLKGSQHDGLSCSWYWTRHHGSISKLLATQTRTKDSQQIIRDSYPSLFLLLFCHPSPFSPISQAKIKNPSLLHSERRCGDTAEGMHQPINSKLRAADHLLNLYPTREQEETDAAAIVSIHYDRLEYWPGFISFLW